MMQFLWYQSQWVNEMWEKYGLVTLSLTNLPYVPFHVKHISLFIIVRHYSTPRTSLIPTYRELCYVEHPSTANRSLCNKIIDRNVRKFSGNEHPPARYVHLNFIISTGTFYPRSCTKDVRRSPGQKENAIQWFGRNSKWKWIVTISTGYAIQMFKTLLALATQYHCAVYHFKQIAIYGYQIWQTRWISDQRNCTLISMESQWEIVKQFKKG